MKFYRKNTFVFLLFSIFISPGLFSQPTVGSSGISAAEFQARREAAMAKLPYGLLLLHARSIFDGEDQIFMHAFQQNPGFYYFTGLENAVGPILALDGFSGESWLFVPPALSGLAGQMENSKVAVGPETAAALNINHVVDWEQFIPFIDRRISEAPDLIIYTDEPYWAPPSINPPGLAPISNSYLLWARSLQERWPDLTYQSAKETLIEMRLIKSPAEIEIMRKVGKVSTTALLAGMQAIAPGKSQREVEAEIVCECIHSGGEGPSFWPWVMSGPNALISKAFESLGDYRHANRIMQSGELVRVDIGCDVDFYKGDVGRTVPVSGKFDPGQRETWNLLIAAYKAVLEIMQDGTTKDGIAAAATAEIKRLRPEVTTELGREAAAIMLGETGTVLWHIHGSGLEAGEGRPQVLKSGMIIEFEPMFAAGGQGFYLEDTILITETGHEILTPGLPYSADEIEQMMAKK